MNKAQFPIVFIGTPEFAVTSLKVLVENDWNIVAVITAPDKESGRGLKMNSSAVKLFAQEKGIPVLQPKNLKNPDFLNQLRSFGAKLQIVVAFRMLPEAVWNMPPLGTFNLHASLLPNYRGAAPINWAIINGEEKSGVTTFFLKHNIDEGDIILQEEESIDPSDNAGSLYQRLMNKGAVLVEKTTQLIYSGNYETSPQVQNGTEKPAPKLTPQLGQINWNDSSRNIHNLVRGLSPVPGARATFNGSLYKIFQTEIIGGNGGSEPGKIQSDNKSFLHITTNDGIISILEIQKEGKRRMKIGEFLVGNTI